MADIKVIRDTELIGGKSNVAVYPVTTTQAVYRQTSEGATNGLLETSLQSIEDDARDLHSKTEKLTSSLEVSPSGVLEINGTPYSLTLKGSAKVSYFGDAPDETVSVESMKDKSLRYIYNGFTGNIQGHESNNKWEGYVTIPNSDVSIAPGTCNFSFVFSYNNRQGINVGASVYFNLRKYFGFADSQPTSIEDLIQLESQSKAISNFSNTVGCTITVPINGSGFKYIYFAVPVGMSITSVTQPDSLNAPLTKEQVGTINRTISGTTYQYKLYKSTDLINSSVTKRLKIE